MSELRHASLGGEATGAQPTGVEAFPSGPTPVCTDASHNDIDWTPTRKEPEA